MIEESWSLGRVDRRRVVDLLPKVIKSPVYHHEAFVRSKQASPMASYGHLQSQLQISVTLGHASASPAQPDRVIIRCSLYCTSSFQLERSSAIARSSTPSSKQQHHISRSASVLSPPLILPPHLATSLHDNLTGKAERRAAEETMSFYEPSNGYSNGGGAYPSTSTASLDVDSSTGWALPPPLGRGLVPSSNDAMSFFSSNHSLAAGTGEEQQQQDYDPSATSSGGGQYSALQGFDLGDGAGSEAGSTYSSRGRSRKRSKAASEGVGGWEGESSGGEGGSTKGGKKVKGAAGAKAKGKGKRKLEGGEEEDQSEVDGVKKPKAKPRKAAGDKKKKAGRACAACQKAHLTCDDGTFACLLPVAERDG